MSARRGHVVQLIKLLLVGALMAFVFYNVQWRDAHIVQLADGEQQHTAGEIVGRWDTQTVTFRPLDADGEPTGEVQEITPSPPEDVVSPGFFTYVLNLDKAWFALGALCYCASVFFASTRWWWLLRVNDLRVTWFETLRFTWIGLFFNNIVPGQTGGDLVKALYIVKHCEGGRMPALVSVLVDRILGLGSLALLGALVVLFALDKDGFGLIAIGVWSVLGVVAIAGVVAFSKRVRRLVRLDELLRALPAGISGILQKVDQAVYFYRGHKRGIAVWLVLGMGNHVVSVLSILLVGEALGVGMPPLEYFVLVPMITILSAFPIGPNGWGVGEALYKTLFGKFGAPHLVDVAKPTAEFIMGTRGVALSVLYRVHLTLWSLVGGVLVLFERDKVTRSDIEQEVEREAVEGA